MFSENIFFQSTKSKSKHICPKVGNFENQYFRLFPETYLEHSRTSANGSCKIVYGLAANYFRKRSTIIDIVLGSKYTSDSSNPPNYFCVRIIQTQPRPQSNFLGTRLNTNLQILLNIRTIRNLKKSQLTLTIFNSFQVFCHAFHALFSTSF